MRHHMNNNNKRKVNNWLSVGAWVVTINMNIKSLRLSERKSSAILEYNISLMFWMWKELGARMYHFCSVGDVKFVNKSRGVPDLTKNKCSASFDSVEKCHFGIFRVRDSKLNHRRRFTVRCAQGTNFQCLIRSWTEHMLCTNRCRSSLNK